MEKIDAAIIGAGVVGLAVACEVARKDRQVYVFESHDSFGRETSSRNSEVIHAGIYYEVGSLKAATCVQGNALLYEACGRHKIPHKRTGKLIVAVEESELPLLEALFEKGKKNGAREIRILTKRELNVIEPNVEAAAAIYSPWTGIVDSHSLMRCFYLAAKEKGAEVVFRASVTGIDKIDDGFRLQIKDATGQAVDLKSDVVINCAGLNSDRIARMAGVDVEKAGYALKYCKGDYFGVAPKKAKLINHLVYPIPESKLTGLGIHATLDLSGNLHLGPNAYYIDREKANYAVDESRRDDFYNSVKKFLPFLEPDDLSPGRSGIRPKLQGPGEGFRDFVIREEKDLGLDGFINLIGIESPGLTGAMAIARLVKGLMRW